MNNYFVYVDIKPDGTPFYIGKGKWHRVNDGKKRNNEHTKVCQESPNWERRLAFMGSESDAFAKEIELIKKYKPTLVNKTDGGEGISGLPRTLEWKKKISDGVKKVWQTDKKQKIVAKLKEAHNRPQTRLLMQTIGKSRGLSRFHAKYICLECGHISLSRWVNTHQKLTKHSGKTVL